MQGSDAYSSTSYSRGIWWLPSPEVCRAPLSPGGSVVSVSDSWPGGCEFDPQLRRLFFLAYFCLSPLQKHMRISTGVRKPGNTCASLTTIHDMTLAVKVQLNPNTTNQQGMPHGFLCVCSTSLSKTKLEKEKLFVTSNFSNSHSVFFYPFCKLSAICIKLSSTNSLSLEELKICCFEKGLDKSLLSKDFTLTLYHSIRTFNAWPCIKNFMKTLTHYHTIPTFNNPEGEAFWKHWGKRRKCW